MEGRVKKKWWQILTVEPTMFIAITSTLLTSVIEQAYFVHKACTVDLAYPAELCNNLTVNINIKAEVQIAVSTFTMFNELTYQVVPVSLSLFMGAWSDRRGRKILLLMGLLGKFWFAAAMAVGTSQVTWSLYMVLFTCTLPASFTGFELALHTSAFGYLSDVSSEEDRTFRLTIMEVACLASAPVGISLGSVLFEGLDGSFTSMYAIYACGVFIAMTYTFIRLDWTTTPEQKPLDICCIKTSQHEQDEDQPNCCTDFFDCDQFLQSVKVVFKKRPNGGRTMLYLICFGMLLNSFQREELQMTFLYTQLVFDWGVTEFSQFRVYLSTIYVFGILLSLPLMNKYLKLQDTTIIMIGALSNAGARVVYAMASKPWLFYLGATLSCLGPINGAVLRSMASKLVPPSERGKVFILLTLADNSTILLCVVVFSRIYNATILTAPYTIFWFTVATQLVLLCISVIIRLSNKKEVKDEPRPVDVSEESKQFL